MNCCFGSLGVIRGIGSLEFRVGVEVGLCTTRGDGNRVESSTDGSAVGLLVGVYDGS